MSNALVSMLLDLSGKMTFATIGIWVMLRFLAFFCSLLGAKPPKFFPISAQRMGFAQALGDHSVILSESDYHARQKGLSFLQRLAKSWWPLVAWAATTQFVILFGAKGLANELEIPFWLGLGMSMSAVLSLGFFRRRMLKDHLRETDLPEGKPLDWDAEAYLGGLRLMVRFEGRARKVVLSRLERNAIAKDGSEQFYFHGIAAQPDSAHRHGAGCIVSEFRMLDSPEEKLVEETWTKKVKIRDALHAVLSAYVVANEFQLSAVALIEYPGAVVMVTPMAEHVEFLEAVADRLMKRKKVPAMAVRDIALSASQEFPSKFDEMRVAHLMAHQDWVSKDAMDV